MDTDLFQILTLILLLGLLLTLFGVLQSLGAIRRALDARGTGEVTPAATSESPAPVAGVTPQPQPEPEPEPQPAASGSGAGAEAAEPEPEPARTGWPAPRDAAASEPEPASATPAASPTSGTGPRVLYGDAGLTTATPNDAALRTGEPVHEPEPEPEPELEPAAAATSGTAEDPQEQPFERDGRWWFRRGDELLVYEEQTGQWVAAGESAPSSSGGGATPAETAASAAPAEGQVTTQQEAAVGSFWKCPSCGAVNGSTATSCRMCFTARP